MKIIEKITDLKKIVKVQKTKGRRISLVPTMGYLHEGHLSLVRASLKDDCFTVMSIFVNPMQFGPREDFEKYPRDIPRDLKMAESAGVEVVFVPTVKEMYPDGFKTYVNVEGISEIFCGKSRSGHFKGVTTVVNKLFNIAEPDKAYFGQKDAQQVIVLRKMAKDLNMNVEIVSCPTVREPDGLAMSSRNVYLSHDERKAALVLSKSLFEVERMIKDGEKNKSRIVEYIINRVSNENLAVLEYADVVDADNMEDMEIIEKKALILLAAKFGRTRLIDNILVEV